MATRSIGKHARWTDGPTYYCAWCRQPWPLSRMWTNRQGVLLCPNEPRGRTVQDKVEDNQMEEVFIGHFDQ